MPQEPKRHTRAEAVGDVTVVRFLTSRLTSDFDIEEAAAEIDDLVAAGRTKLVLNFGDLRQMSSAALGKLLALRRKLDASKGALRLCHINPDIREVFEITKLVKSFTILPDEQAALRSF
ncbi:MAG TPA: STAS domain-containing protein [Isosphaeraceae bacterium]|jgi:anti-anti-sigma factor|nr:STAS domain-containing protein [Isosphaeraceae bacterium]